MTNEIDRLLLLDLIALDDASRAAGARRAAELGGAATGALSADDDLPVPARRTAEDRRLRDRLAQLGNDELTMTLAAYWAGRHVLFDWPVDETTYRGLVALARGNLDGTAAYLAGKANLGDALRAALAIQGA